MKIELFRQIKILAIVVVLISLSNAKVSDERLCADPECSSKYIHSF